MPKPSAENFDALTMPRLFERLCGLVALEAQSAERSRWIGALLAAKASPEMHLSTVLEIENILPMPHSKTASKIAAVIVSRIFEDDSAAF